MSHEPVRKPRNVTSDDILTLCQKVIPLSPMKENYLEACEEELMKDLTTWFTKIAKFWNKHIGKQKSQDLIDHIRYGMDIPDETIMEFMPVGYEGECCNREPVYLPPSKAISFYFTVSSELGGFSFRNSRPGDRMSRLTICDDIFNLLTGGCLLPSDWKSRPLGDAEMAHFFRSSDRMKEKLMPLIEETFLYEI